LTPSLDQLDQLLDRGRRRLPEVQDGNERADQPDEAGGLELRVYQDQGVGPSEGPTTITTESGFMCNSCPQSRAWVASGQCQQRTSTAMQQFPAPPPLRRNERAVFLYAFDLLELNGRDLRREPIEVRKAALANLIRGRGAGLQLSEHIEHDAAIIFEHACKLGLEGLVSKRRGSRYLSGRSSNWIKLKNPNSPGGRELGALIA
jgi:hypothetical protein